MFEMTVQQLCDVRHKIDRNDETYSKRTDPAPDVRAYYIYSLFMDRPHWPSAIDLVQKGGSDRHKEETPIESFDDLLYSPHTFVFGEHGRDQAETVFDYVLNEISLSERNRELARRLTDEIDRTAAPAEAALKRELAAEIGGSETPGSEAPVLSELSRPTIAAFLQKKFTVRILNEEHEERG